MAGGFDLPPALLEEDLLAAPCASDESRPLEEGGGGALTLGST